MKYIITIDADDYKPRFLVACHEDFFGNIWWSTFGMEAMPKHTITFDTIEDAKKWYARNQKKLYEAATHNPKYRLFTNTVEIKELFWVLTFKESLPLLEDKEWKDM